MQNRILYLPMYKILFFNILSIDTKKKKLIFKNIIPNDQDSVFRASNDRLNNVCVSIALESMP